MVRPWVLPANLRSFTEHNEVNEKTDDKLAVMISIAERKVIDYCKHDFTSEEYELSLPQDVKNAVLIIADSLSYNDSLRITGSLKSESYDDYSYTVDVHEISTDFDILGVSSLLDPYVMDDTGGSLNFRIGVI